MGMLSKLFTLFRGVSHEAGQAVVDKNAITILDQEIRDTSTQLNQSRQELAKLMAQGKLSEQKMQARQQKIAEYTRYIEGALAKGDEALAREVAGKLAPLETEQQADQAAKAHLDRSIATLKATIHKAEAQVKALRTQVDTVKATASVQKAQMAIASRTAGATGGMSNALESLERIKQRQAETAARLEASEELDASTGDSELNRKLAAAGLLEDSSSADAVLARFKRPAQLGHEVPTIHATLSPEREQAGVPGSGSAT
ncbi:PspA/IM30 family protein [Lysobacter sp. N42]|jgi:phage shock protein A|uniref:PspA/IM30 family protein n=1 Tax=Lysobacter sp. N42 TaxID=2545719 RepID=UPI0010529EA5|nr:PspA/IM30 family protein [Lysobacter sp. N42]